VIDGQKPFNVTSAVSFVIPSGAEGSAVLRTRPGNVFDRANADTALSFRPRIFGYEVLQKA
jgi:hypothetical protein